MPLEPHPHPDVAQIILDLLLQLRQLQKKHELIAFAFVTIPRPEQHCCWNRFVEKVATDSCDTIEDMLIAYAERLQDACNEIESKIMRLDCAKVLGIEVEDLQPFYGDVPPY